MDQVSLSSGAQLGSLARSLLGQSGLSQAMRDDGSPSTRCVSSSLGLSTGGSRGSEGKSRNFTALDLNIVTSTTFYWPKQDTRPVQSQRMVE